MTPSWTLILLVFVFWTYPAAAAVAVYRMHDSSIENVIDAYKLLINDASKALNLDGLGLDVLNLDLPNLRFQSEA